MYALKPKPCIMLSIGHGLQAPAKQELLGWDFRRLGFSTQGLHSIALGGWKLRSLLVKEDFSSTWVAIHVHSTCWRPPGI